MSDMKIKNLSKCYSGNITDALLNFSIEIKSGEILCIVGASGSGKSCLARALVGALPLVSGQVQLGGRSN